MKTHAHNEKKTSNKNQDLHKLKNWCSHCHIVIAICDRCVHCIKILSLILNRKQTISERKRSFQLGKEIEEMSWKMMKNSFLSVKCVNCIYADIFLRYILEHNQTSRMATKMKITCACGANRCLSFWRLYVWPFFIRCHCSLFSILFVWQNAVPSSIFKKKKSQL